MKAVGKGVFRRVLIISLVALVLFAICLRFFRGTADEGLSAVSIRYVGSITNGRSYTELICVVSNGSPYRLQVQTAFQRKGPNGWLQQYESFSTGGDVPEIPSVAAQSMITNRIELADGNFAFRCAALCWKDGSIMNAGDAWSVIKMFATRRSISVECFTPEMSRDTTNGVIRAVVSPERGKE